MVDDKPVENATPRGRYETAEENAPHIDPEVPPIRGAANDSKPPETIAGALPENAGKRPEDGTD
jgi:hypothetical protein